MNKLATKWITRGVPAITGMGLAWVAMRIVRNEGRLLLRELELQDALATNSWKEKSRLLRGH
ncbi:hypothetical protein [Prochlorococcus sp. MIT 1307]|uniref:hypothetical protein n=1 Tax=Prochlorococcus sp. MIT 1307 TaxID=3096219 RepID=UPI002A74D51D|nr:hypothetical protein [Prochlorococcus sp. MIT 1307]